MNFASPIEIDGEIVAFVVRDDEMGVSLAAEKQIYLRNTNFTLTIASMGGEISAESEGLQHSTMIEISLPSDVN